MSKTRYMVCVCIILAAFSLAGCSSDQIKTTQAKKGEIDLSWWDFHKDGNIELDGEWAFYWRQFLNYREVLEKTPDLYAVVPENWNRYKLSGENLPGQGYATYRLHVRTGLPAGTQMGLRPYAFSSAYSLYINEKLVASNGKPAAEASAETGAYRPQAVFFTIPAGEFDIILQVSNYQYAKGGFWYSLTLGSPDKILDLHDRLIATEAFLLGALIIMALFYLAVYILRREFRYALFFSCLCLLMAVSLDMVGQFILPRIIPGLSLKAVIFIWYTSTTWVLFFLILYVHELYKSGFSRWLARIYFGISFTMQLLYIFTAPVFYTKFAELCNYVDILAVLGIVAAVAAGIKKDIRDGWLHIMSVLTALTAYIHDILFWTNRIKSSFGEWIYPGIFIILFLQTIVQAKRIKYFYDDKTAAELSFLQSQIKPHFLYNTLNTFISISYYNMEKARELLYNFSNYLRRSFDFRDLSQLVPLKNELELVKAYLEIEKARFEERIEVVFNLPDDLEDKVPLLMLQPIVENAVVHGILPREEGGRIEISIRKDQTALYFKVKDNGVGMGSEKQLSMPESKAGSGVGLSNIDHRLKKLYGKGLEIKSTPGNGTEVSWRVPRNNKEGE